MSNIDEVSLTSTGSPSCISPKLSAISDKANFIVFLIVGGKKGKSPKTRLIVIACAAISDESKPPERHIPTSTSATNLSLAATASA